MTGRGGILGLDPVKGDRILVDRHLYRGLDRSRWFELTADPRPAGDGTLWVRGRLAPLRFLGETQYGPVVTLHILYPPGLVVERGYELSELDGPAEPPNTVSPPAPAWAQRGPAAGTPPAPELERSDMGKKKPDPKPEPKPRPACPICGRHQYHDLGCPNAPGNR